MLSKFGNSRVVLLAQLQAAVRNELVSKFHLIRMFCFHSRPLYGTVTHIDDCAPACACVSTGVNATTFFTKITHYV